ncbi:hypothetical protein KEM52_003990, partial [Ascosphaera acerosa]
ASFVITKKGLNQASSRHGFEVVVGESANFAAYAFAPAILVTPLGALSVLIGAVLGSYFLNERLGVLGKLGCALSLLGSVIIVLHAPPDKPVESVDEILDYATDLGFLAYIVCVIIFCLVMIYKVAPTHGRRNPLVYISICSAVGSISVMSVKAFGIALKLTLEGNNQFTRPSTYLFAIVVGCCVLTQMNYFNKALSQFSTSIVNPVYYVMFTTATLCASFILFHGFNTSDSVNVVSLLCGFLIIFSGVYLLNMSRNDPDGKTLVQGTGSIDDDAIPTDSIAGYQTRRSLQVRRSADRIGFSRGHRRSGSSFSLLGSSDRDGLLMRNYDPEDAIALEDLSPEERRSHGTHERGDSDGHRYSTGGGVGSQAQIRRSTSSSSAPVKGDANAAPTAHVSPLTTSSGRSSQRRNRASSLQFKSPPQKIEEQSEESDR